MYNSNQDKIENSVLLHYKQGTIAPGEGFDA